MTLANEKHGSLYIMRHGKTDWNEKHKIQGRTDIPLNDEGRKMAAAAAAGAEDLSSLFLRSKNPNPLMRRGFCLLVFRSSFIIISHLYANENICRYLLRLFLLFHPLCKVLQHWHYGFFLYPGNAS